MGRYTKLEAKYTYHSVVTTSFPDFFTRNSRFAGSSFFLPTPFLRLALLTLQL
jgi:hypothetical protein